MLEWTIASLKNVAMKVYPNISMESFEALVK